jgi:hypothetical protein
MKLSKRLLLMVVATVVVFMCAGAAVYAEKQQVNLPNINEIKSIDLEDGWGITTDRDALLILYYMDGVPNVLSNGKAMSPRDYYTVDAKGQNVYLRSYQLRKGKRYVLQKASSGDRVAGCYADCNATLKNGKYLVAGSAGDNVTSYFKVKTSGNGIISLNVTGDLHDNSKYKVKLFNSKKKPLSKGWETLSSSNKNSTVFGVKKGTFYVGVQPYGSSHDALFDIKATFQKKSVSPAGSSKKKAKKLKLGQTKKGILFIGEKKSCWYKVKMKKARKVRVVSSSKEGYGGSSMGFIRYEIKGPGVQRLSNGYVKLGKGTSYVKIYRTKNANGYFTFKLA